VFGYTTSPPVINNQTDAAGSQTIGSVLPLKLIKFTASITDAQQATLKWTTAQETNTKHFEIEWSTDGVQYTKISMQQAAGNSSSVHEYNYLHNSPAGGSNYYRLKMADIDGRFTYSPVLKLNSSLASPVVAIFPNPVADIMNVNVKAIKNETVSFYLYNAEGKLIGSRHVILVKGSNLFTWDVQHLSPGSYFIKEGNNQLKSVSIIKQ
jgi:Secretion system C-terminal sorting domain